MNNKRVQLGAHCNYYYRHSTLSIDDGVKWLTENLLVQLSCIPQEMKGWFVRSIGKRAVLNGVEIKRVSLRLTSFLVNGTVCSQCGLQATHFALERDIMGERNNTRYHLNLWAATSAASLGEEEILFTVDHTIARCLGGSHKLNNTTTMCSPCNGKKAVLEDVLLHERTDPMIRWRTTNEHPTIVLSY